MEATVKGIKNLSQTLTGLIRNVLIEVDEQRTDMFKTIENVASIEFLGSAADGPSKWHKISDQKSSSNSASTTP
jgi:hypothetical protein